MIGFPYHLNLISITALVAINTLNGNKEADGEAALVNNWTGLDLNSKWICVTIKKLSYADKLAKKCIIILILGI